MLPSGPELRPYHIKRQAHNFTAVCMQSCSGDACAIIQSFFTSNSHFDQVHAHPSCATNIAKGSNALLWCSGTSTENSGFILTISNVASISFSKYHFWTLYLNGTLAKQDISFKNPFINIHEKVASVAANFMNQVILFITRDHFLYVLGNTTTPGQLGLGPNIFETETNTPQLITRTEECKSSNRNSTSVPLFKRATVGYTHCIVEAIDGTVYGFGSVCCFLKKVFFALKKNVC